MTFGPEARDWLARAIGTIPRSLRIVRMTGATSSSVFLVDPDGALRALFSAPHTPQLIAEDYRRIAGV